MVRRSIAVGFAASLSLLVGACASLPPAQPDLAVAPIIVRVEPTQEFLDTGITVQKGQEFFFTAVGDVPWDAKNNVIAATPDGRDAWIGVRVGQGGLVGRIDATGKPFDIGARTTLFKNPNIHSHRYRPPPPIRMRTAGHLFLGFKDFQPDHHRGAFEVTIRPVKQ